VLTWESQVGQYEEEEEVVVMRPVQGEGDEGGTRRWRCGPYEEEVVVTRLVREGGGGDGGGDAADMRR
jgi:hypothetical protein